MIKTLPRIIASFLILLAGLLASAAPEYMESPIFTGGTGGYYGYRIPSISRTNKGTLLAFCEGRKNSLSDRGDIDILIRRSTDQGLTWSPQQVVVEEGGTAPIAFGNPVSVIDRTTGIIHLLCCRNNDHIYHLFSTDDALTWSTPVEITSSVKLEEWGWYATGPGQGIQLKRGPNAGRLVVPCDHRTGPDGSDTGPSGSHLIYSDDHGATWQIGASAEAANFVKPNETNCVELVGPGPGGESRIYVNTRNESGGRGDGFSLDSGNSYTLATFSPAPVFTSPIVQGALQRFHATDEGADENRILFSCPNSGSRFRISIWSSFDEAISWSVPKLVYAGPSAYSDMARTSDGRIAMLYENGVNNPNERITFARFNEDWLDDNDPTEAPGAAFWTFEETPPGGTASTSPDAILDVHPDNNRLNMTSQLPFPVVPGAPAFGNGSALRLAGNGGVQIADAKSDNRFDFGIRNSFTLEVACRMDAGSSQVGALIAKDFNPLSPSWWLRVDGGKAKFLVSDTQVECVVVSSASINDGQWHHVAAVRDATNRAAKQLRIYVDGQLSGTAPDTTTGSFASGQDVWIGRYNNGSRLFTGDIDFARITQLPLQPESFVGKWTQFDADADGIPDTFERAVVGNLKILGLGDLDDDGIADDLEYAIGTNPLVSDFPNISIDLEPGFARVHLTTRTIPPWMNLQLRGSTDLVQWQNVESTQTLTPLSDGLYNRLDRVPISPKSSDRRFFRYRIFNVP